ncbi:hypothetical protein CIPAW_05G199300 [Carya illinoinensis]|uniref:Secreted protein n=1 Tax=Carya illinoinensis TaxID=32201 RepID=A0A8T1QLC7_CARIL|nr:hypothetical protein CIPAW_05G199300 [Carya illinoinensis]
MGFLLFFFLLHCKNSKTHSTKMNGGSERNRRDRTKHKRRKPRGIWRENIGTIGGKKFLRKRRDQCKEGSRRKKD